MKFLLRKVVALAGAVLLVSLTTGSSRPGMIIATHDSGWTNAVDTPLFDSATYVPGDCRTARLAVKNTTAHKAALRIEIVNVSGDSALLSALRLRAEPATGDARIIGLAHIRSTVLMTDPTVESHGVVHTRLRLTLPRTAGNATQQSSASFALKVVLGDRHIVVPGLSNGDVRSPTGAPDRAAPGTAGNARAHGALPTTGGATAIAAMAAAALIGLGAAVVYGVRHQRRESR